MTEIATLGAFYRAIAALSDRDRALIEWADRHPDAAAALLDGTAAVVPVEPANEAVRDGVDYRLRTAISGDNTWPDDTRRLYGVMLAAGRMDKP